MNGAISARMQSRFHTERLVIWALLLLLLFIAAALGLNRVITEKNAPVVTVLLVLTGVMVVFELLLVRNGIAPFLEIGGFLAVVCWLYSGYPLIVYLANGMAFTTMNDNRLWVGQPTPIEMTTIGWMYVVFLSSFCVAYGIMRGRRAAPFQAKPGDDRTIGVTALMIGALQAFIIIVQKFYGLAPESYMAEYVAVQNLPRFIRQIYAHSHGMIPTLSLFILAGLFARYRARRVWVWLGFAVLVGIAASHESRTPLFLLLFSAVMLYHHLVRPLTLRAAIPLGILGLVGFVVIGFLRLAPEQKTGFVDVFISATEFETIFANAYDLHFLHPSRGILIGNLPVRLSDIISPIPQQFLPFTKLTPAEWYLVTYYPDMLASGGGNAFGVVAEAVTGHGWPELVARGVFLGLLFGWLQRWASSRPLSPWMLAFYVWVTMWAYQSVRNTTMPLVGWFVYRFALPLMAVTLCTLIITRVGRGRRMPARA